MIITLLIGSVAAADTTSNTTTSNKQTSSISSTTTPEVQKTQATTHKSIENSTQATQNTQIKTENTKVQTVTNANKVTTNNKVENTSVTKTNKSLKSSSAKTATKTSVTSIRGNKGAKITIKATVTTNNDLKVVSGKTAFKINGKTIGQSTVKNGVTTLPYTIPTSWKDTTYTITVVYGGYNQYISSTSTGKLTLEKSTSTKVLVTSINGVAGQKINIQATVTTQNGVKVTSGKVAFKINGKTIGYGTVANGVAKLSYTIPNWTYKTYTITAVYGGYNQYKSSEGTSTLKVVKKSDIPSGFEAYLKATKNCEVTNSKIKNLAAKFNSYTSTLTKAKAIFNQLNKITSYSGYYNTRYGAVGTLNRGYGNCVDMAHLLNAVARASGIPARYCHATCYFRSGLVTGHVWSELYVDGKWYKCDLTSNSNSFGSIVNWNSCGSITRYISLPF